MQPNILVFFTDQQRWDTVGCYNPAVSTTPVLDQLAREGVKFENAFTVQPVCGPARSCLQTGRYPTQNGCYRNNIAMRQDEVTLAKLFNQAGYDTAYIGKWHWRIWMKNRYRKHCAAAGNTGWRQMRSNIHRTLTAVTF